MRWWSTARIVALLDPGSELAATAESSAQRVIDATGKYVIPGGVDVHTHMELPLAWATSSDTFETGTRAAAWGGTTTIIDFATQSIGGTLPKASRHGWPRPRATAPSTTASTWRWPT
ncbi:MAG: amidohydrolase family protein [Acidimicrobiales bacterium]